MIRKGGLTGQRAGWLAVLGMRMCLQPADFARILSRRDGRAVEGAGLEFQ